MPVVLPPSGATKPIDSGWEIRNPRRAQRRGVLLMAVLLFAFSALLAKVYLLQIVQGSLFLAQAQKNRLARVPLPAPRGVITDRNGDLLSTSRMAHAISVVPALLPSKRREPEERLQRLQALGHLVNTTPDALEAQILDALKNGARAFDPVPVASGVDLATVSRVEENRTQLGPSVLVTDEPRRYYPQGELAAHVLGYVGLASPRDLERAKENNIKIGFDESVGKSGVERYYDDLLRGSAGSQAFEVDAQGRPIAARQRQNEKPGATLRLSIDDRLQKAAEDALRNARNSGAIAAIDPRNGEILALASNPTFDPNIFSLPRQQFKPIYQNIVNNPKHPLIDRAVVSRFPPGSTFKPFVAVAGLEKGAINQYWSVNCPGYLMLGRKFGCWQVHGAGINLNKALAKSCDVYFYQVGLRLGDPESTGPSYLAETVRRFGLGSKTGVDLPSDDKGLVPDPAWRRRINAKHPDLARWFPGNTLNMSIGQGDVLATPLQMANATAAIANGGTLWTPHLLCDVTSPDGKPVSTYKTQGKSVGARPENLALVRAGMRYTVTNGTGKACDLKQVAVAGKTGSAEDVHNALPHSWWTCFAPYDHPRIAIAVIVENSGHGSENALPVAKAVLEAAFPMPTPTPKPKRN